MDRPQIYKFKKGDKKRLDDIYFIQGIIENDWWDYVGEEGSEDIIIKKSFTVTIKIKTG